MNNQVFIRKNGVFGGVCGGLAGRLGVNPLALRLALCVMLFFTGGLLILFYLAAMFSFPDEVSARFGDQPKFLGVCHSLAPKIGIHESWLRFFTLITWIFTAFVPVFAVYMIFFLLNAATTENTPQGSRQNTRDVN